MTSIHIYILSREDGRSFEHFWERCWNGLSRLLSNSVLTTKHRMLVIFKEKEEKSLRRNDKTRGPPWQMQRNAATPPPP